MSSSWPRIVSDLSLDTNGAFGVPLQVAASVYVFVWEWPARGVAVSASATAG